ncbi:MAG TPA: TIGR03118 family protein [Bryobacteraceae bacterium]|nr:TIGR03118 family protein [Bryobacteraceae bacterium]
MRVTKAQFSFKLVIRAITMVPLAFVPAAFSQGTGSNVYVQHNLVADLSGVADVTDPNLIVPWGMTSSPSGPLWVTNIAGNNATVYNGAGAIQPQVIAIPGAGGGTPAQSYGAAYNGTTGFVLGDGQPASFIFSTTQGTIAAWNGSSGSAAQLMVDNSGTPPKASYDAVAVTSGSAPPLFYAVNFITRSIEVYDTNFRATTLAGNFTDPNLPAGYSPFNIRNFGGKLYVAFIQGGGTSGLTRAPGAGLVDVFDQGGNFVKRLTTGGTLNAPYGMAIAPPGWGAFGNAVLVANFGDSKINAFDPDSGNLLGTLQDQMGNPIVIPGVRSLLFGNGGDGGDRNTLYFASFPPNPDGQPHGLLGSLAPAAIIPPSSIQLTNAASGQAGPIAPGEMVVIRGANLGPVSLTSAAIPRTGSVGTSLAGVSVTFNGTAAPVLSASAAETKVIVPYELAGSTTASIVLTYNGATVAFQAQVAPAAPGLFTADLSGSGPLWVFRTDDGPGSSAVARGSSVLLFATGEGSTNPPGQDGAVTADSNDTPGPVLRMPVLPVSLTIGGQPATVTHAYSARGSISAVMEIEVVVPQSAPTGTAPVVLTVNGVNSQQGATVAVR